MENMGEMEPKRQERKISLSEEFTPFDPEYVHKEKGPKVEEFSSSLTLNISEGVNIPFDVSAAEDPNAQFDTKADIITPFDPKEGYPIGSKKQPNNRELHKKINFRKAPLTFGIAEDLSKGLQNRDGLQGALKVLLIFPNQGPFEGKPQGFRTATIDFGEFSPVVDAESSAIDDEMEFGEQAYKIRLPSNITKLSQMRVKFVLVQNQPKEPYQI